MTTHEEFLKLINYSPDGNEEKCVRKLEQYFENKFNLKVYKCVLEFNSLFQINNIYVYFETTEELNSIPLDNRIVSFNECDIEIQKIIASSEIGYNHNLYIFYSSFEFEAVCDCYRESIKETEQLKTDNYNRKSMDFWSNTALFIVYKNKEFLEQAISSGEIQNLKDKYYKIIKKHDTFNFINPEKNLLIEFDYQRNKRNYTYFFQLFWAILEHTPLPEKEKAL